MLQYWLLLLAGALFLAQAAQCQKPDGNKANQKVRNNNPGPLRARVGAYYFASGAGENRHAQGAAWAQGRYLPFDASQRMLEEFPDREPVWGWRDDSLHLMERQIDLAADHGLTFLAFDWYWYDNGQAINEQKVKDSFLNLGLELFLKAQNNQRLKFCLLVANHDGFEIKGTRAWKQAADFWMPYFKHPQHLTVDGKPLIIIFSSQGADKAGLAYLQEAARSAGLPGVAVAGCWDAPAETGFTHRTHYNAIPHYEEGLEEHKFQELVNYHQSLWKGTRGQPYIPCVVAGWDRRPRENPGRPNQKYCWYYPDRSPAAFQAHLQAAVNWMDQHPEQTTAERIVVVYAWNEWGEGGYLVPTKGDPRGEYLQAVRSVAVPEK